MALVDVAFRTLPKHSTFFVIWRVENMQVVTIPKEQFGCFYTGDSYIVCCATEPGDSGDCYMKSKEVKGPLSIHIHFWLGAKTSQDEAGVAAYKTVELDDYLGGSPVQHREVQDHESKRFLSYFKRGIRLLEGGIASGFTHVNSASRHRMFVIKGKRRPIVKELPSIDWSHMNDGDVFVIDSDLAIFVWMGKYANNMEKLQGALVSQQLRHEHGGGLIILVEDGKENNLPQDEKEALNQVLPLSQKVVRSYKEVEDDSVADRRYRSEIKLYRCSDAGGALKVTEVKSGPIDQKDLNSQDSFIIDNGASGIWVWVGKKASQKERTEAMRNAQGFIKKKSYPNQTPVTRVIDGGEPFEFKALFRCWKDDPQTTPLGKSVKVAKTVQTKFEASILHKNLKLAAATQMVDNGAGEKEVYRVEQFELFGINTYEHGKFYSNECYVILYSYQVNNTEHIIIYYWLGNSSDRSDRTVAASKAAELDDTLGGRTVQVRVCQGKEPPHFLAMFKGKMIILQGPRTNNNQILTDCMLQIQGWSETSSKAVQVPKTAASLNSGHVFIVFHQDVAYLWAGKGSTGDEREMAKKFGTQPGKKEVMMVLEGQEKPEFWEALGGQQPYPNHKRTLASSDPHPPRLFHCGSRHPDQQIAMEEVIGFGQGDLVEEDVMLLDAWDTIFVWVGQNADLGEVLDLAEEYLLTDPSGRTTKIPIVKVYQGFEPPNFTGFFPSWDPKYHQMMTTFEGVVADITKSNQSYQVSHISLPENGRQDVERFSLEMLQIKDPQKLPEGVNPSCKEMYLTDEDFYATFGIPFEDFMALPRWKQIELKKAVGLF